MCTGGRSKEDGVSLAQSRAIGRRVRAFREDSSRLGKIANSSIFVPEFAWHETGRIPVNSLGCHGLVASDVNPFRIHNQTSTLVPQYDARAQTSFGIGALSMLTQQNMKCDRRRRLVAH